MNDEETAAGFGRGVDMTPKVLESRWRHSLMDGGRDPLK